MKTTGLVLGLLLATFSLSAADFAVIPYGPAYAISADGASVIGQYNGVMYGAGYRWQFPTNEITLTGTADPRQQTQSALAVDADGGVAVGYVYHSYPTAPFSVYNSKIWQHISPQYNFAGSQQLSGSCLVAISANGNIVAGFDGSVAKVWTLSPSSETVIGSGMSGFTAMGMSADGNKIAGTGPGNQAYYWTTNSGMVNIGFLPGATDSYVSGLSGDGSAIAGQSGGQAFLWTQDFGMYALGNPPGETYTSSRAMAVSHDGKVVVGWGNTANGQEAFIWDYNNGMRNLKTVLQSYAIDLSAITLSTAVGVSSNGLNFCGNGTGGAWFASIAPKINYTAAGTNILLSWPTNHVGFNIESSTNISGNSTWSALAEPITVSNGLNLVSIAATNSRGRFFRLRQ